MSKLIQAVRGMNDVLPLQSSAWQYLEAIARDVLKQYGYSEVRLPIVEKTELFSRSIGEVTDVVEKEMYTFNDRSGDSLTLRPEGTAGAVRAGLEHGLFYNQTQRWWYIGPMFRHERPQKGRYRQFYQLGVEAVGLPGPDIDAEMIVMTARLWQKLGIQDHVKLELNSLGSSAARLAYRERLVAYFTSHASALDEDSQRRLHANPLRILDSKNPAMQALIAEAPKLAEHLDEESKQHFTRLQNLLNSVGIPFELNPNLVRGLDYYSHTVFEWTTTALGAQGTVCGGGRYDGLIAQLGGQATPAIGFAMGLERLLLLIETLQVAPVPDEAAHIYLILLGDAAEAQGLQIAETIRASLPAIRVVMNCGGGGMKAQFKRADKSQAKLAFIVGEDELAKQQVAVKHLREERAQENIALNNLLSYIKAVFSV